MIFWFNFSSSLERSVLTVSIAHMSWLFNTVIRSRDENQLSRETFLPSQLSNSVIQSTTDQVQRFFGTIRPPYLTSKYGSMKQG